MTSLTRRQFLARAAGLTVAAAMAPPALEATARRYWQLDQSMTRTKPPFPPDLPGYDEILRADEAALPRGQQLYNYPQQFVWGDYTLDDGHVWGGISREEYLVQQQLKKDLETLLIYGRADERGAFESWLAEWSGKPEPLAVSRQRGIAARLRGIN